MGNLFFHINFRLSYSSILFISCIFYACNPTKKIIATVKATVYPISIDGKYGLTNASGTMFNTETFDDIRLFSSGLAVAKSGDQYGYINQSGEWIIKPKYSEASDFYDQCACVIKKGKSYYINKKGHKIAYSKCSESKLVPSCYEGSTFETIFNVDKYTLEKDGIFAIKYQEVDETTAYMYDEVKAFNSSFYVVKKDGKYGFFFRPIPRIYNGNTYIRDTIERYTYDEIIVSKPINNQYSGLFHSLAPYHLYRIGDRWGILNDKQQQITSPKYLSIVIDASNDYFFVEYKANHFGYVDTNGQELFMDHSL